MNTQPIASSSYDRAHQVSRGHGSAYIYIVLALIALTLESVNHDFPSKARTLATDIVMPVLTLLEKPVRGTQDGLERLAGVSDIYQENQRLHDENDQLRRWREAATQLMRENEQLRSMLKVPGRETPIAATARVIGVGGGAFERNFLLNVGSSDSIKISQPVVDARGLIGRIHEVGYLSSRVLLVTDLNSRIPVRIERTGALAIAEGQNEDQIRLRFLPSDTQVVVGDIVLTSGHGGMFPPDLPVARVVQVDREQTLLQPFGMFSKIDRVRVMDYNPLDRENPVKFDQESPDAVEGQ